MPKEIVDHMDHGAACIQVTYTDREAECVLKTTGMTIQAFVEMNARVHIKDCVQKQAQKRVEAAGLKPVLLDSGLDPAKVEALIVEAETKKEEEREAAELLAELDSEEDPK